MGWYCNKCEMKFSTSLEIQNHNCGNTLLNQVRCEKHDMVLVTQTTTTTGIDKQPKVVQWMQCKNCSHTIPLDSQKINNHDNTK